MKQCNRLENTVKIVGTLSGFMVLLVAPALASSTSARIPWSNSLKPKGKAAPAITLAANGKSVYAVLIPAKPDAKEERSAAELSRWLKQMTTAQFAVVKEGSGVAPRKYISVGRTQALLKARLPQSRLPLNPEGVAIGQQGDNLYLFGGARRGPLYAVMAFLEEDLGCRWYSPTSTVIPNRPTLTVSVVPRIDNPRFVDERFLWYMDAEGNPDWEFRVRFNSPRSPIPVELGGHINYASGPLGELFGHTVDMLVPSATYFKDHPEYYAMHGGVRRASGLCETNTEVHKIAIRSVLEALRASPKATVVDVSRMDSTKGCRCPVCAAVDKENHSNAASLIVLVNAVADAVAKEFPQVKVSTLAYEDAIVPPTKIRPRDNVTIRLCNNLHAWANPITSFTDSNLKEAVEYRKIIEGWSAICKQISVWEYTVNFDHYAAPMPNMHLLGPELRFYADHKVTGMMLQGDYTGRHSDRAAMRMWVMAKLMWNPWLDTNSLIRDFNSGYYGKAAGPVQAYDELLNKVSAPYRDKRLWRIRIPMTAEFLNTDFVKRSLTLFEEAETLAAGDPELVRRVEVAKMSIQYVVLSRRNDFSKEQYTAAYEQFSRVALANGVSYLQEPPGPTLAQKLAAFEVKARGRQAPSVPLPAVIAATVPRGTEAQNVIDFQPRQFTLPYFGMLDFIVDDPQAASGKSTRNDATTGIRSIQAPLTDVDDLYDDPWHVYVLARVEPKAGAALTGEAQTFGVYDVATGNTTATVTKTLAELAGDKFHIIDLGVTTLKSTQYVFAASVLNPNTHFTFVERIILVRQPKTP